MFTVKGKSSELDCYRSLCITGFDKLMLKGRNVPGQNSAALPIRYSIVSAAFISLVSWMRYVLAMTVTENG